MKNFIGHRKYVNTLDMKVEYMSLARQNEKAAILLQKQGLYNEAVYMYIQAMEKKIKGYICGKIDASNVYFSNKHREVGHSLDMSIDFLIEILSGNNETLKQQLSLQLKSGVFENINFSKLHNDCRYPNYNSYEKKYFILDIDYQDCLRVSNMNTKLEKFINDFDRL